MTSIDMAGASVSVLKLDNELTDCYQIHVIPSIEIGGDVRRSLLKKHLHANSAC